MKVKWSPVVLEERDCIIGYIDSDWNINLGCLIQEEKYPILIEIGVLFHELFHWLFKNSAFDKVWDRLWKPILLYYINLSRKA